MAKRGHSLHFAQCCNTGKKKFRCWESKVQEPESSGAGLMYHWSSSFSEKIKRIFFLGGYDQTQIVVDSSTLISKKSSLKFFLVLGYPSSAGQSFPTSQHLFPGAEKAQLQGAAGFPLRPLPPATVSCSAAWQLAYKLKATQWQDLTYPCSTICEWKWSAWWQGAGCCLTKQWWSLERHRGNL